MRFTDDESEVIDGILSFLDAFQDRAAGALGKEAVYGSADWVIVEPQDGVVDRYFSIQEALEDMTEEMMERGFAILHRPDPGLL